MNSDSPARGAHPIWAVPTQPRASLCGREETRVIVVGGGLTGILLAYHLSGERVPCAVLEGGILAQGASGRNAGFLLTGDHYHYSVSKDVFGAERARTFWRLTERNHEILSETVGRENIDCEYRRTGSLRAAVSEAEAAIVRKSARELAEDGFDARLVRDPGETGSEKILAAIRFPSDGEIHPVKFVLGLAAAAEKRGARIHENSRVVEIRSEDSHVLARTGQGEIRGYVLVFATNAFSAELWPLFAESILPVRGQMMSTEPISSRVIPCPTYLNWGQEYVRQLATGEVLAGGGRRLEGRYATSREDVPTTPVQQFLDEFLTSFYPVTRGASVLRRWGGLMGFSCDELPNAGFLPGTVNLFVCGGYTGHGLGMAAVLTKMSAQLILTGSSDLPYRMFDPRRHT